MPYTFPQTPNQQLKKRAGRPAGAKDMSPQSARTEANRLLHRGLSEHAWHVIELLAQSGVLSTDQLSFLVSFWTLEKYARQRIIDRITFAPSELQTTFITHGLPFDEQARLYVLGPVGIELAQMRLQTTPVTGHLAYRLERIMHDVLVNEIVLRLSNFAGQLGWRVSWAGPNDGALYNTDCTHKILEPDALVTMQKENEEPLVFCIEYHGEDKRTRAEQKIDKYENVRANNAKVWQTTWKTETFPGVLAVFRKRIVGEGYRDKIRAQPVEVQFYGKLLEGVMQDNLAEWANFNRGKREVLFS